MTRARRWTLALGAVGVALVVTAAPTGRLRHLAIPMMHDPSVHATAARLDIRDGNDNPDGSDRATERAQVPGRVSAILPRPDGVVFIGTFDSGLYRFDPAHDRVPVEIGALDGRERFVDALIEHDGHVIAGTHRGAVVLSPDGARAGVIAAGEAVSSLAVTGGELFVGTAHGLWRGSDDLAVGERGPDGEVLRVTALAVTRERLWIGTPDGVYVVVTPVRGSQVAMWHPLVFGSPGATSNVVTALVAEDDGVVAGTDDGGLVFVNDAGVDAVPFAETRANDINPGAMTGLSGAVVAGTEGAGLVALDVTRTHAHRIGSRARISAVASTAVSGTQLWFGSEEGAVYSIALARL